MQLEIFVLDGGYWDGQYSFSNWHRPDQQKVIVTVPEESEVETRGGRTLLRTAVGVRLTPAQVLNYCRMGVNGYVTDDISIVRQLGRGSESGPLTGQEEE